MNEKTDNVKITWINEDDDKNKSDNLSSNNEQKRNGQEDALINRKLAAFCREWRNMAARNIESKK